MYLTRFFCRDGGACLLDVLGTRRKPICSFSVRMNLSATPLVSGSRTKAKLGVMPKAFSRLWKYLD